MATCRLLWGKRSSVAGWLQCSKFGKVVRPITSHPSNVIPPNRSDQLLAKDSVNLLYESLEAMFNKPPISAVHITVVYKLPARRQNYYQRRWKWNTVARINSTKPYGVNRCGRQEQIKKRLPCHWWLKPFLSKNTARLKSRVAFLKMPLITHRYFSLTAAKRGS